MGRGRRGGLHHRAHDGTGEHHDAAEATTTTEAPRATSATIRPLFARGDEGGVGTEIVTIDESTDGTVRLDFSEDEPGGLGDQSRAASWNAVTTATLLTGRRWRAGTASRSAVRSTVPAPAR